MNEKWKKLIQIWRREIEVDRKYHQERHAKAKRINNLLGFPSAAISGITGTAIFSQLSPDASTSIGILVFIAGGMTALNSFGKFSELSIEHKLAANRCRMLRKELDFRESFPPKTKIEAEDIFKEIKKQFKDIPASMMLKRPKHVIVGGVLGGVMGSNSGIFKGDKENRKENRITDELSSSTPGVYGDVIWKELNSTEEIG
jgi:hypothetical protein